MTGAVKQRLVQLRALLDILDQQRPDGEYAAADLQEQINVIELTIAHYEAALKLEKRIAPLGEAETSNLATVARLPIR